MTDNLNSQPLSPGMGFLQVSFGLGDDAFPVIPPVFIPEEPALKDAGEGRAFATQSPKIGLIDIVEALPVVYVSKSKASTIAGAIPKISSSEILTEVSTLSTSSSSASTVVGATPKIGSSKILLPPAEGSKSTVSTIVKPRPKISGITIKKK